MAIETIIAGAVAGDALSKLSTLTLNALWKAGHFKKKLRKIQETIDKINSILPSLQRLNEDLGERTEETQALNRLMQKAEDVLSKCEGISRWNIYKRIRQAYALEALNKSLSEFFHIDVPLHLSRDLKTLVATQEKSNRGSWSGHVPMLKRKVIGFDERLKDLKQMLLNDAGGDECCVVAISGVPGSGKTTLATMLCRDAEIKGIFGSNIYFASITNTPNLKWSIRDLLQNNQDGNAADFATDAEAIRKWGVFVEACQSPVLLVLDDVWSNSIIHDFESSYPGYKILVTSRATFPQFNTYKLLPLDDQDAIELLRYSAFSERARKATHDNDNGDDDEIPVDFIDKYCRKLPLALSVIGRLLNGARVESWELMLRKLAQGPQAVLDLDMDEVMKSRLAACMGVIGISLDADYESV
ncbi:NB-ARC domains-containing protein [Artemisia annua]|uniref:NB-ARC domains-containing protein n=1 Tax=Artemisia annua TaxID=35608 RepID=A0A2U1QPQ7_ARTAN|nr:NB-ARC domains-containing protein [Artemisia annua]